MFSQNFFKSLFISFITVLSFGASALSIRELFNGFDLAWLGVFIAAAPFALLLSWFFLVGTARTSANLMIMLEGSIIGLLITTVGSFYNPSFEYLPFSLSLVATISTAIYIFWYSRFSSRDNSKLKVDATLPGVDLWDLTGKMINTDSFIGKKTLMIFYRGNWCPLCMVQIKELAKEYQELADNGTRIALVSPQPFKHTKSLAKKFDVPFEYYVDRDNKAAKQLGIFAKSGLPFGLQALGYDSDTVMPTVVITDASNQIHFADLTDNYRVRPEPSTFKEILSKISN